MIFEEDREITVSDYVNSLGKKERWGGEDEDRIAGRKRQRFYSTQRVLYI